MFFRFQSGGQNVEVSLGLSGSGFYALIDGTRHELEVLDRQPGQLSLRFDGRPLTVHWADDGSRKWLSVGGCTYALDRPVSRSSSSVGTSNGAAAIRAPMPAQVRAVQVAAGERVSNGQVLLLLEAMKMEIQIKAPADGLVNRLMVVAGQTVDRDQVLVEIGE